MSTPRPGRFTPGKETPHPLFRWLVESQGRSGLVRKMLPPLGFDPRTVQLVATISGPTGSANPYLSDQITTVASKRMIRKKHGTEMV